MERLTAALLILALICAGTVAGYFYGDHTATAAAQLVEKARTALAVQVQADADDRVLANEKAKRAADNAKFTTYKKEHEDADHQTDRLVADLRAGNRRLRAPVQHPVCPAAPAAGGSAAGGSGDEGHAELTADASVFVVGLLKRGDDAIRKHAAVVDLYENLRTACIAPIDTTTTQENDQ